MPELNSTRPPNGQHDPPARPQPSDGDVDQTTLSSEPYASVFWQCDCPPHRRFAQVTIGWSVVEAPKGRVIASGAWGFQRSVSEGTGRRAAERELVEEPVGVLYQTPTKLERELNEQIERLLADYFLVLTHRLFFGQCSQLAQNQSGWPGPDVPTVDMLFVFGPTLPKFVGRVCYTPLSAHLAFDFFEFPRGVLAS